MGTMITTIGELIDQLEAIQDKTRRVEFDLPRVVPTCISSWRGVYAEAALNYTVASRGEYTAVNDLLARLRQAIDPETVHTGWKGGSYLFHTYTPLWIDNPGEWHNVRIRKVTVGRDDSETIVLKTKRFRLRELPGY